jgi:hypothetical protein
VDTQRRGKKNSELAYCSRHLEKRRIGSDSRYVAPKDEATLHRRFILRLSLSNHNARSITGLQLLRVEALTWSPSSEQ